jgi:hypothetical protein
VSTLSANDRAGDDPIVARIERIVEGKRRDNAEALSALKVADDAWGPLGKEIETAIGDEFDLVNAEREAVEAAKGRLVEPEVTPSEEGFVVAGRVFERESKTGLPGVLVRIAPERGAEGGALAEVVTDAGGAFAAVLPVPGPDASPATSLRVAAHTTAEGRPVAVAQREVRLEVGGVEQIDLPVARNRGIADRVAAGEAAGESVDGTITAIERRLESMRAAHTATTRFSELTQDGLRELSEALAVDPPPVEPSVPREAVEPFAPLPPDGGEPVGPAEPRRPAEPVGPAEPDGPAEPGGGPSEPEPEPERPTRPERSSRRRPARIPLEEVRGLGPRLADALRGARIRDARALVDADFERVAEVLGEERARQTLKAARALLRRPPEG